MKEKLFYQALGLVQKNAKAISALVVGLLVNLALHLGFNVPQDVQLGLDAVLVAAIVWLVPNKG